MRVASEVALSSTIVVVVAFVVCANTDDSAKVVPMIASAAITRLTVPELQLTLLLLIRSLSNGKELNLYGFRQMTRGRDILRFCYDDD
jgi:hypothetical protein